MFFIEVLIESNLSWKREEFFSREVTSTAIWPKMFALIIEPSRIMRAAKQVYKVVRGPTSLPVSMRTE